MPSKKQIDAKSEAGNTQWQNNATRKTTSINGVGLWHSWTRNFKSPILAILDLLDNAFDAGFSKSDPTFKSKIHISEDKWYDDTLSYDQERVTGIIIANNSAEPICDILSILEVYKSTKSDSESIGENGVGLKQGCATISDLSFVLIRSKKQMSIGLIAKDLQHEEGAFLPSYPLNQGNVREELKRIFMVEDPEVGKSAAAYGFGDLNVAIDRLNTHIEDMCNSSIWNDEKHVFRLIMDKIIYSNVKDLSQDNMNEFDLYKRPVVGLMREIKAALPSQYIHIPKHFDVKIGLEKVYFNYWQCRLVDLSVFHVKIDPDNSIIVSDDWKDPMLGYNVRIFLGFDPIRFVDSEDPNSTETKALSLNLYSRQSGRLIRHDPDGRSALGLFAGGSTFCQGLTVIVDDFAGQLPLNPTKQDLAFSNHANGQVHEKNLYLWLNAIVGGYYKYVVDQHFKGRKGDLSKGVKKRAKSTETLFRQRCDPKFKIKSLAEAHYTSYTNAELPFRRWADKVICCQHMMTNARIEGDDSRSLVKVEQKKTRNIVVRVGNKRIERAQQEAVETEIVDKQEIITPTEDKQEIITPTEDKQDIITPTEISTSNESIRSSRKKQPTVHFTYTDLEPITSSIPALPSRRTKKNGKNWQMLAEKFEKNAKRLKTKVEKMTQEAESWKAKAKKLQAKYTESQADYMEMVIYKNEEMTRYRNSVNK